MSDRRGINPKAFKRMVSADPQGCPVFLLYLNSTSSTGTSATEVIVENAQFAFRVLRAWFVCTEAPAADSEDIKLLNGSNAITDTADYSALADTDSMEWTSYDDAYTRIAEGSDLKITKTATTAITSVQVYVLCARVA